MNNRPNLVAWPGSPRRTGPDFAVDEHGFPITTNTLPAPLDGAHAATSVGAEPESTTPRAGLLRRLGERITPAQFWIGYGIAIGTLFSVALVHLAARFGVTG